VINITFGGERKGGAGRWRELHNRDLHNLYPSLNGVMVFKSRINRCEGSRLEDVNNTYIILSEDLMGKGIGRLRRSWRDNIKIGLIQAGCEGVDCIHLVQNRIQRRAHVATIKKFCIP
jgi:hypothetical protein